MKAGADVGLLSRLGLRLLPLVVGVGFFFNDPASVWAESRRGDGEAASFFEQRLKKTQDVLTFFETSTPRGQRNGDAYFVRRLHSGLWYSWWSADVLIELEPSRSAEWSALHAKYRTQVIEAFGAIARGGREGVSSSRVRSVAETYQTTMATFWEDRLRQAQGDLLALWQSASPGGSPRAYFKRRLCEVFQLWWSADVLIELEPSRSAEWSALHAKYRTQMIEAFGAYARSYFDGFKSADLFSLLTREGRLEALAAPAEESTDGDFLVLLKGLLMQHYELPAGISPDQVMRVSAHRERADRSIVNAGIGSS